VSEQLAGQDIIESSPGGPIFGLEHLVPSRLGDSSLPSLGPASWGTRRSELEEQDLTPRSRTKHWVQLPQRQSSEEVRWWSDDSRSVLAETTRGKQIASPISVTSAHEQSRGKHKARGSNRTLDQQSFWNILRGQRSEEMSSLYASRWATTPPVPEHSEASQDQNSGGPAGKMSDETRLRDAKELESEMYASRWAATPPLSELADEAERSQSSNETDQQESVILDVGASAPNALHPQHGTRDVDAATVDKATFDPALGAAKGVVARDTAEEGLATNVPSLDSSRSEPPPRPRKRVSWHGKTCIISIPNINFDKLGLPRPMGSDELQARMQQFEDAGYSTQGFDLPLGGDSKHVGSSVKSIYPNEVECRVEGRSQRPRVSLPDLKTWSDYMNWLTEQRLAALGVSTGLDEPSPAPMRDTLRHPSNQYPPLPFSPPLPTTSAGSMGGRPGLVRGHSHTMSVASPISPGGGPFGHMHRHSTFAGPFGFPQQQQLQPLQQRTGQQIMPSMQSLSSHLSSLSGQARVGSPAHLSALRQDLGQVRGPSSPLGQQSFLPQSSNEYSRSLMEDQHKRQHIHAQSVQLQPTRSAFVPYLPQLSNIQQTHALPKLPEGDDEEEPYETKPGSEAQSDPNASTYLPPHKRAQFDADIAVPTPIGHRHNISEGLEREILESEQRRDTGKRDYIEVTEEREVHQPVANGGYHWTTMQAEMSTEREPQKSDHQVQEDARSHKKSASRFDVAAPSFTFNPGASFQPDNMPINFGAPSFDMDVQHANRLGHNRQASSGPFNVAAPAFMPANAPAMPKSDFSFSAQGPSFDRDGSRMFKAHNHTVVDDLPSIFRKVDIYDIVKPVKKSKAIAIVRPDEALRESSGSGTECEDDEGRITQGDDRLKRQRFGGDDGDEVPRFAEVTPMPADLAPASAPSPDRAIHAEVAFDSSEIEKDKAIAAIADKVAGNMEAEPEVALAHGQQAVEAPGASHGYKPSTSLSALAGSFETAPKYFHDQIPAEGHEHFASVGELEDGEIQEDEQQTLSPAGALTEQSLASAMFGAQLQNPQSASERIQSVPYPEPSFDELDAIMRQLNETEDLPPAAEERAVSSLSQLDDHTAPGIAEQSRGDAPSPNPARRQAQHDLLADSAFAPVNGTDGFERAAEGWAHVHRLNKAEDVPASDWSDILSPNDQEKLYERTRFFDTRIDNVIDKVVEQRLLPIEDSLRSIRSMVNKRSRSATDHAPPKRSSSAVESDADDEDDLADAQRHRPISRGRDKRVDQIKAALAEALREQSPRRSQPSYDPAEFHSALADLKVSFARAASASLKLDDIRAVVEDVLHRQSQAIVGIPSNESREAYRREVSELEGRLDQTLAGALEEANYRRAVEEREAEAKRMLRIAEDQLQLLRDRKRDESTRSTALENEHRKLLDRTKSAESARDEAEDKAKSLEAENEAMQATLEEYRLSSSKWRQDLDDGKREREELEDTIATMEAQAAENQESSTSMKRRLEKLHADMATAAGQLMSEKSSWKASEDHYRARCEVLEVRNAAYIREREQLQDEVRSLRMANNDASAITVALDHLQASNASLEAVVHKLQSELAEQQSLAARFEREFHDAKEAGRAEVHRTRMSMEIDVAAANHQVNTVRAGLESELSKVRLELENVRMEAETAKARHDHMLEEEENTRREALRKVNQASSIALDEARQRHETTVQDLRVHHTRSLNHASEDKQRSEYISNERLALADAKLQHFQERVQYLEERLEVANAAAHAAALNAQPRATPIDHGPKPLPEKISPQALRESILVLQEQLQDREARIDRLQNQVDKEGSATLKERDTEITWLRELLAVRNEDLTDLVGTLSQPTFDRDAVRDIAIRIRANLQMQQQERERFAQPPQFLAGQALASLSSFATPKAAQLTSAFNKWRSTMENSSLKNAQRGNAVPRSSTPSKEPTSVSPLNYAAGLMTPPASNLRTTPTLARMTSLPPARLQSRNAVRPTSAPLAEAPQITSELEPTSFDGPTTPLFREQSYDQDAEDNKIDLPSFEDDNLDVTDSEPPAFRSLESELELSSSPMPETAL